jgi:hypothetical protein
MLVRFIFVEISASSLSPQHIAVLLSTPKLNPTKVEGLLDTYFPSFSSFDTIQDSRLIFIKHMNILQFELFKGYRERVMDWYEDAVGAFR